jgi:hypothetical protein
MASVRPSSVSQCSSAVPGSHWPATTENTSATTPKKLTSPTWPLPLCIATPMTRAMGIEARMVDRPQGLSASAFTTTSPRTAIRMTRMAAVPQSVTAPANGPTSSRIIRPRERPPRRSEQKRIRQS